MVMRLVGEEAALCLKNRDRRRLLPSLEAGGGGGLADVLKPKVRIKLLPSFPNSNAQVSSCSSIKSALDTTPHHGHFAGDCRGTCAMIVMSVSAGLTLPSYQRHFSFLQ